MATIPTTYGQRRVGSGSRPIASIDSGGAIGRATENLGRSFGQIAEVSNQIVEEDAAIAAAAAETDAARAINEELYNPENGFLTTTGENAIKRRDEAFKRIQEIEGNALSGLDWRAAKRAKIALAARMESARATIDRHTASERRNWLDATATSRASLAADEALRGYADDDILETKINEGLAVIDGTAKRLGWSPEETELKRQSFVSDTLKAAIMRRAKDNPIAALDFARANGSRLTGADLAAIESTLEPLAKDFRGKNIARGLMAGAGSLPPTFDRLLNKREGGGAYDTLFGFSNREGGQFAGVDVSKMTIAEVIEFTRPDGEYGQWVKGKIGRVATPVGAGQIVGTTLRNAVKELGISEDVVFASEVQNRIIMHLAARRLKPGMSQSEKRAALKAEWDGFKHASTADLDAAILEIESGAGGEALSSVEVLRRINDIPDARERDAALAEYKMQEALKAAEVKKARADLEQAVFEMVITGQGRLDDLDPEVLGALGRVEYTALRELERKRVAGEPIATDRATLYKLNMIAGDDPMGFAGINLLEYSDKLSNSDFEEMVKLQVKAREGKRVDAKYGSIQTAVDRVAPGLYQFGKAADTSEGGKALAVWSAMKDEVDAYVAREGKQPSEDEMMTMARRLISTVETSEGWFGMRTSTRADLVTTMTENFAEGQPIVINGETVTPKMMQDAMEVWREAGLEVLNSREAIDMWIRMRADEAARVDPNDRSYSPAEMAAPSTGAAPGAGGAGTVAAGPSGAGELGVPGSPQAMGAVSTREPDPFAPTAGVTPIPDENDAAAWNGFGSRLARAVAMQDEAVRLSDGTLLDAGHWTQAVTELGMDASYGDIARRAVEIARAE